MGDVITFGRISYNEKPILTEATMKSGRCKVMRCGNSLVVALPKAWRDLNEVKQGDYLEFDVSDKKAAISFKKAADANDERKAAFESLMAIVDRQPDIPWEDDSRESVRALIGERYEA